jgi:membrane-bound lytic murein transglycosylase B
MTKPRRWAWRAALSALAGGGVTAASLYAPLSGGALGTATSTDGSAAPVAASETSAPSPAGASQQPTQQPTSTTSTPSSAPSAPQANAPAPSGVPEAPSVVVQRRQQNTATKTASGNLTATQPQSKGGQKAAGGKSAPKVGVALGPNNVALPPQLVAGQIGALAAELAGSAASTQALAFYRIPLFLLPIYQAAAVQYGVPWQILAAINEIETNYGVDQSVSTAGAVGWMQFMPATWMQYGVDALNAGYADPYNPVDAIFAAARYLRAAGAASNLRRAILAYNHSDEYVSSVFLRAKLISTYPKPVIATLTGLIDDGLPVTGKRLAWGPLLSAIPSSSATANATAIPSGASAGSSDRKSPGAPAPSGSGASASAPATPGSLVPPSPTAAAAVGVGQSGASPQALRLVDLMSAPNAAVVAVQDGRIVQLGNSRNLGNYVILRDVFGDVFTYTGLGSIAPSYRLPKAPHSGGTSANIPVAGAAGTRDPAPTQPATAGRQGPVTLRVRTPVRQTAPSQDSVPAGSAESTPAGMGKVRLFSHPGNPDARAAAANAARIAQLAQLRSAGGDRPLRLQRGSVVARGTVLGHVRTPLGATDGHLRFAILPAGDLSTIDPRPILANWMQLDAALHPQGVTGENQLLGATASDVFLFSKSQLEHENLSDPGIVMSACYRHEVASGAIDKRALAVLAFLSRSGLKPSVGTLRCGGAAYAVAAGGRARGARTGARGGRHGLPLLMASVPDLRAVLRLRSRSSTGPRLAPVVEQGSGYVPADHIGDGVVISQINGVQISGHQGPGSITDRTIRTLLTLQGEFVPHQIVSLMKYPGAPSTLARPDHGGYIEIVFPPAPKRAPGVSAGAKAAAAHSAGAGRTARSPLVSGQELSAAQWNQLIGHIATLPVPAVAVKPSSSAIPDPKRP